jgi:hypothetical protein
MVDEKAREQHSPSGGLRPRMYSPNLQPLMQSLLATLANIDFEYEHEISRVRKSSTESGVKTHLLARLQERHRERRSPYIQQLAALERRIQTEWA